MVCPGSKRTTFLEEDPSLEISVSKPVSRDGKAGPKTVLIDCIITLTKMFFCFLFSKIYLFAFERQIYIQKEREKDLQSSG